MGTGGAMALGAGGGLLGGMLLADAMQPDMNVENNYYGDDQGGGDMGESLPVSFEDDRQLCDMQRAVADTLRFYCCSRWRHGR